MVLVIQMFMLLAGASIIIICKTNPSLISKNEVFRSGMIAIVAVIWRYCLDGRNHVLCNI